MSFSSDKPAITNQLPFTTSLPSLDQKELFVDELESRLQEIADAVNQKTGGLYTQDESFSSDQYYSPGDPQSFRNVYRKTFDLVRLAGTDIGPGDTVGFPHEFDAIEGSAMIYANCATNDGKFFTAVWPDVWLDDLNVNFTNPATSPLNQCDVVANILKEN